VASLGFAAAAQGEQDGERCGVGVRHARQVDDSRLRAAAARLAAASTAVASSNVSSPVNFQRSPSEANPLAVTSFPGSWPAAS
jgi:hypothetical protein